MKTTHSRAEGPVGVGDEAPDADLADQLGRPVSLSEFWRGRVLVLVFTRHFG